MKVETFDWYFDVFIYIEIDCYELLYKLLSIEQTIS